MVTDDRALVGALLWLDVDQARAARAMFDRDDLTDDRHRVIVDLVDGLLDAEVRTDPVALSVAARTSGTVPAARLAAFGVLLADLFGAVPHPSLAPVYARGVVEAAVRRRISEAGQRLCQAADSDSLAAVLAVVAREVEALGAASGRVQQEATA